ncbi:MAG: ATP-binding protein [Thermodesulforhabdaceae bacterium]|jgi:MinD superfamily P-loop ATPase
MVIAVASGKGGTGKTTLAVNLAYVASRPVKLVDCDVEEPNVHLFLRGNVVEKRTVSVSHPSVDEGKCSGCGECAEFCQFNALAVVGKTVLVFQELCHSCGGCMMVCPEKAIDEEAHPVGIVEVTEVVDGLTVVQGTLSVGVAQPGPVIRAVKLAAKEREAPLTIIDCPPGTSCPVVESLKGADVALLVTEPTPFGLHDLSLAVETVRTLGIPFGVVINKAGTGFRKVQEFLERESIPLLGEIPENLSIARTYAKGEIITDVLPGLRSVFEGILMKLIELGAKSAG